MELNNKVMTDLFCHRCKHFIQDGDSNQDFCSGSENCYAENGFPEFERKQEELIE